MKYKYVKILKIECTLDSSEAVMFTKGGQHSLTIKTVPSEDEEDDIINFRSCDVLEISFQLQRDHQSRFDSLITETIKHRAMWDEINNQPKDEAKKRMAAYAEQAETLKPKPKILEEPSTSSPAQE